LLGVAAVSLVGCEVDDESDAAEGTESSESTEAGEEGEEPQAPGGFDSNYLSSPDFFTLMEGPVEGSSPHKTVQIWYSSNARQIIEAGGTFEVPEGTTSIKEFDTDNDGNRDGFAVMVKMRGDYDEANGNWFYEMRDAVGETMTGEGMEPGANPMCIDCHSNFADTDYLGGIDLR
jgi:hypothetical protein